MKGEKYDYSREITTITTAGASWTATEDCFVAGRCTSSSNNGVPYVANGGFAVMGLNNDNLASGKSVIFF